MSIVRVRVQSPPGHRACGNIGANVWLPVPDADGGRPFASDIADLRDRFATPESRAVFMQTLRQVMDDAQNGRLPWDDVTHMASAPDVLEVRLPDWWFSGGKMHVRLYFSEPTDLPGTLCALRLRVKRPGPFGVDEQDTHVEQAARLLREFAARGYA
jgi:hypothetical protein